MKKLILYHAVTTYHLLSCITHRQLYHPNVKSCIMISNALVVKFPNYLELENFFDRIIVINTLEFLSQGDANTLITDAVKRYNRIFKENRIQISDFDEIIIAAPHFNIGFYLQHEKIKFTMMEEASGIISRPEVLQEIEARFSESKTILNSELGFYDGNNELIDKIICNLNTQINGYSDKRVQHFDLVENISKLNQELIEKVLLFFGVTEKIAINLNSTLLLTQHYANLKIMRSYEQKELYNLLVDYFIVDESKLVIKPHPDDLMYYELMFPEATVIREKFPSELLPFIFTEKPEKIMTVTSTAINNLENIFEKRIRFSVEFEKNYHSIHRYYVALDIIKRFLGNYNVCAYQVDSLLLDNLSNHLFDVRINHMDRLGELPSGCVIIIDDVIDSVSPNLIENFIEKLDDDSFVIFLNTNGKYSFYNYPDKNLFNKLVPIEIIRRYEDDFGDQVYDERTIFIYTKREELKYMATNYEFTKTLGHLNSEIKVKKLSKEEQRIKILEAILEATERRLEHYIKLEAELRSQLNQ